mmetsp:Transcript_11332/g.25192  ORF Transcript_11332/g.25192 Transcript_11332/m.25192 type:complete len:369 (+) Transcript_11332:89-1195(+)
MSAARLALAPARRWGHRRLATALAQRCYASEALQPQSSSAGALSGAPATGTSVVEGAGASELAVHEAASAPALATAPSRVADISFKGPMADDIEGGARYHSSVGAMWSNIPQHIRASFGAPASLDEAPKSSAPLVLDTVVSKAKSLVASTGLAPAHWAAESTVPYYGGRIELAPYRKGQTAAYNYPRILVPRELAHRFPLDMYVDPVFQTSDPDKRWVMRGQTLFPKLQGKTTLLFIFSGQPLSGLWTGLQRWLDDVGDEFRALPKTQVFKLHCEEGWFNRRTHQLTKFHLRRQVEENELFTTFVYHGKWKWEYVHALHLYDKELPVVLLLDPLGYVRWHAVGLPTEDATGLFRQLSERLAKEKRSYM